MAAYYARPPFLRPLWGHPILLAQSCWFVANDVGRVPLDILNLDYAAGSLGANVSYGATSWGQSFVGDGSASSIINLGSTNRFIAGTTTPLTVAWVEKCTTTPATGFAGIFSLQPTGITPSTKAFACLRASQGSLSASTYGRLTLGPYAGASAIYGFTAPPNVSDKIPCAFIVTCAGGAYSQTAADYICWWRPSTGGSVLGIRRQVSAQSGNSATGVAQNYFGYDGYNAGGANTNKFTGGLDNLRVWNRVLSDAECVDFLEDPYIGCVRVQPLVTYVAGSGAAPGSPAQSRFFLAA